MINIKQFLTAVREAFRPDLSLGLSMILYALLLASIYVFAATREATVVQVLITFLFLLLIPVEFFILQSTILAHAQATKWHWRTILANAFKLFVVTLPILILGYLIWILLAKWQIHHPAPRPPIVFPPTAAKPQPLHWPTLLFATVRGLLFVVLLPLATIHLWIEVAGHDVRTLFSGGAGGTVKRLGSIIRRAFSSSAAIIYAVGLVLFALVPYVLLVIHPSPKGTKTDFAVFVGRLLLVFVFTLCGWILTLTALSRRDEPEPAPAPAAATAPVEATA